MTLKSAQQIARANFMSIRKTSAGDYRVNIKGGSESQACYEETIIDALNTAKAMHDRKYKRYWVR